MQLFDGNNHQRDTIGTPIHKISAWETGLPERWDILVDLSPGEVVPLTDYSRQWNLRQSWGASLIRKCNKSWAVKTLERWLRVLFLVTYYVICSRAVKLSEVLSVSPGTSKGAVSQQCWVLLESLLKICTVYILKIPEFYCWHHGRVCLPRLFLSEGQHLQLCHPALWFTVSLMMYSDLHAEVSHLAGMVDVLHKMYTVPNTRDLLNHLTFLFKNREVKSSPRHKAEYSCS